MMSINEKKLTESIREWLDEDIGSGDVTSMVTIPGDANSTAIIHMKEAGTLAGLSVAAAVFREVDPTLIFEPRSSEGARVHPGDVIAVVTGSTRSILQGERLALNLLQRMSGIATRTRMFTDEIGGLPVRLVDTRKTTPGHRMLEKYAVRVGGGYNHRFGLYDAVMIKDNHIKGAGGITRTVRVAREQIPHTMKIEVEVESFEQLDEALEAGADIIMLDNMKPESMAVAVRRVREASPRIIVEASGSITLENIRSVAESGVDVISVGRLTYSVHALDISLDLNERKEQLS
ncbi:MAG: carboxylating nicotinate-nucleotide diphosphorylase [Gorillibacterium sp.]|nr:carboxylating nicotinate-nucleotide diphosphorylase [Gorillibacterium sp.]